MPRQRSQYRRRTYDFPGDFPERLERLKEESRLPWAEINRRLGVHPQTMRRWRKAVPGPACGTCWAGWTWPTTWGSAISSRAERAACDSCGLKRKKGHIHGRAGGGRRIPAPSPVSRAPVPRAVPLEQPQRLLLRVSRLRAGGCVLGRPLPTPGLTPGRGSGSLVRRVPGRVLSRGSRPLDHRGDLLGQPGFVQREAQLRTFRWEVLV